MKIKFADIAKACNGKVIFGDKSQTCNSFSKDTRNIKNGDVYIGIKGNKYDGNHLYKDALKKGAKACIVQSIDYEDLKLMPKIYPDRAIILVDDTLKALQKIAEYKRNLYNIPVIAITGSVGKTSTKDLIASVVATKYKVLKTEGNLNNHIGLPLTLLNLDDHEALVVEMGMNNLGELTTLSKIAKPTVAVITNIGTAHIGNLGSRENIRKAKLEILDGLQEDGTLIINNDNDMLHDWYINLKKEIKLEDAKNQANLGYKYHQKNIKIITYGINNKSDFMAQNIKFSTDGTTFQTNIQNKLKLVEVPVGGIHFVYNALCGVAVGELLNIETNDILAGIKNFKLSKNRMELISLKNGSTLINDCYNANYDSVKAGLEYLSKTAEGRKIAVLGDMLELGGFSKELHEKVGEEVVKNNINILITIGKNAEYIANYAQNSNEKIEVFMFNNNSSAVKKLKNIIKKEDTILVKASNGMHFSEIVTDLKNIL